LVSLAITALGAAGVELKAFNESTTVASQALKSANKSA
jgi:hypothetical protein